MAMIKYRSKDIVSLDFGLNIEGTSHKPSEVKIVVHYKNKTYGVIADESDGQYKAEFDLGIIPNLENDDKLELCIEILLNSRVFRPYKRTIEIVDYSEVNQTAEISNQEIDKDIENKVELEVKEEIKEAKEKIISKPYTTPAWAKDILNGKDIPKDLNKQVADVIKSVMGSDHIEPEFVKKPEKISVKFNKSKNTIKIPKTKIEIPLPEAADFSPIVKKKSIKKREIQETFKITEGKITYI